MTIRLLLLIVIAAPVWAQSPPADAPPEAVVEWIRTHAIPLAGADPALPDADLDALAPVWGDALVLAIGEGTHGTREFFQFRDRVVRWLARRGDLDAVLWETALAPSLPREGALTDPDVPLEESIVHRSGMWATEENVALLAALREHNLAAERPVRFVGADMSDLTGGIGIGAAAAARVGGEAADAYAAMAQAFGADPAETCTDRRACFGVWETMTAARARQFAEAVEWLADALHAAGEPWTVTVATRAPGDLTRQFLPFILQSPAATGTALGEMGSTYRQAQRDAQAAADTLAAVLGEHDPAFWASVGPVVTAIPGGADVYRDSLDHAGRFAWDETARTVRARLATGRFGDVPELVAHADALVAWLDVVHESLRRAPTHMDFDNYREVALGRNVAEIADAIGGDGRVVFAAHNMHVGYNPSISLARRSSGAYARDALGDRYLAVGTFFGRGSFQAADQRRFQEGWDGPAWRAFEVEPAPGSFEAALAAAGLDAFALDLRQLPDAGPVAEWFATARPVRDIGNSYHPDSPEQNVEDRVEAEGFDVVVFFQTASRAVPTPAEIERGSYDLGAG
ncbi:erythromycin esterase family protein [Rubrivirga sp. IMCC45206]|uniref:erythromycin esterase family protein n=1 Tax=Rubrivirga sp. IMCC45206 TaxID=3391614 RepID=UPI00399017C8